jgi:hypothetical protein
MAYYGRVHNWHIGGFNPATKFEIPANIPGFDQAEIIAPVQIN